MKKAGNTTTYYPNDSYSIEGATTTRFIYANGALIATVESNGTATSTRYYHPDHLGGTNVVTSELANVIQTLDYYPYGDTRIKSGSYSAARTFIKELQDLETDLNYLNARYYDNNRGQFLSQDPMFWSENLNLTNPQSFNTYSYAENNPVNRMDPSGKQAQAGTLEQVGALVTLIRSILVIGGATLTGPELLILGGALATAGAIVGGLSNSKGSKRTSTSKNNSKDKSGRSSSIDYGIRPQSTTFNPFLPFRVQPYTYNNQRIRLPGIDELRGKSPTEIDQIMKEKGLTGEPTSGDGGVRYPVPGQKGDQVRTMPGNPKDPNPVKQGPYGRTSQDGIKSDPYPLEGNPTLIE